MSFTDQDYDSISSSIVNDFVANSGSLSQGVIKAAQSRHMNVNEARRLLEQTNVKAHLTLFEKQSDDKYVEFDVADPEEVCAALFHATPSSAAEKTASFHDFDIDLENEHLAAAGDWLTKTAAVEAVASVSPAEKMRQSERAVRRLNKVAGELHQRAHQAYLEYEEGVVKIADDLRNVYAADLGSVALDVRAEHGDVSANLLAKVAQHLRVPVPEVSAAALHNHYPLPTPLLSKVATVLDAYNHAVTLAKSYAWLEERGGKYLWNS